MVILEDIPKRMRLRKGTARHALPICGSPSNRSNSRTPVRASHGPAGLGDPDPGAGLDGVDHVAGRFDALPENIVAVLARCIFKVREAVGPNEVAGLDDDLVLGVHPRGPSIDVSDLNLAGSDGAQHASYVVDLVCESLSIGIPTVEILTANRYADYPIVSVLLHSTE